MATASIYWMTDSSEWVFQGSHITDPISPIGHATHTLKIKDLKVSEGNNVPWSRSWLLSVCAPPPAPHPPTSPQSLRLRGSQTGGMWRNAFPLYDSNSPFLKEEGVALLELLNL